MPRRIPHILPLLIWVPSRMSYILPLLIWYAEKNASYFNVTYLVFQEECLIF